MIFLQFQKESSRHFFPGDGTPWQKLLTRFFTQDCKKMVEKRHLFFRQRATIINAI